MSSTQTKLIISINIRPEITLSFPLDTVVTAQ